MQIKQSDRWPQVLQSRLPAVAAMAEALEVRGVEPAVWRKPDRDHVINVGGLGRVIVLEALNAERMLIEVHPTELSPGVVVDPRGVAAGLLDMDGLVAHGGRAVFGG